MAQYSFTNYLENALINATLRGQPFVVSNVYVGLFTADPTETGSTANEVNKASYERQLLTFGVPIDGQSTNNNEVLFPIAQEDWGLITHAALLDAQNDGNMLYYGPLDVPKSIGQYSQFRFPAGYVVVTIK